MTTETDESTQARRWRRLICLGTLARLLGDLRAWTTLGEWRRATGLSPMMFEQTFRELFASGAVAYVSPPLHVYIGYQEHAAITLGEYHELRTADCTTEPNA